MPWPETWRGKGVFWPDCRSGGQHRWGQIKLLVDDRRTTLRACRYCLAEVVRRMTVVDGKLVEVVLKDDSRSKGLDLDQKM